MSVNLKGGGSNGLSNARTSHRNGKTYYKTGLV
jgi:hypothetical protein